MIIKKSKVVMFSVISTILVWGAWGLGVSVGRRDVKAVCGSPGSTQTIDLGTIIVKPDKGAGELKTADTITLEAGTPPDVDDCILIWRDDKSRLWVRDLNGTEFMFSGKRPCLEELGGL